MRIVLAAAKKENLKSYNQRFIEMKNSITLPKKKFLIIDKKLQKTLSICFR